MAVVGHVEWATFARVERVPGPGEIARASERWQAAAGGGAAAALRLRQRAGGVLFLTALGDDAAGRRAAEELRSRGVDLHVAWRPEPQRTAFVHVDGHGERAITVMGRRLEPAAGDDLPWDALAGCDGIYLTAGDAAAIRAARAARVLTSTPRIRPALAEAGVRLDALLSSAHDAHEAYRPGGISPEPALVVRTAGSRGGSWTADDGRAGEWQAAPLPGPVQDSYGAGDTFAAILTWALACGRPLPEALAQAAGAGARALTERAPCGDARGRAQGADELPPGPARARAARGPWRVPRLPSPHVPWMQRGHRG